jgi:hypothetical protein
MATLVDTHSELFDAMSYVWPESGPYIPHEPSVPQDAFLWLQCIEALYGGAAGGGKSDALLMSALQYVDVPGYSALLMRKTYTELMLEAALLDRAHKWLDHTDANWNGETMRFTFPSGARLAFGYLQHKQDRDRYQSAEFQFIGIDELTKFEESDYRFMFSRLRKPPTCPEEDHADAPPIWDDDRNGFVCDYCGRDAPMVSAVPLRMRSATNPGGKGHKFVKDRFITPWQKKEYHSKRAFIPAKLSDNKHVDQTSYREALAMLEPELVDQLLEGNWDAREPGNWMMRDPRWIDAAVERGAKLWSDHLSGRKRLPDPVSLVGSDMREFRGLTNCIDWGEHTQGYVIWPLEQGGIFVPPSEVVKISADPMEATHAMLEISMKFEHPLVASSYDAAGIQSMRTYLAIARKLKRYTDLRSTGIPFNKYKREGIGYLRTLARRAYEGETERFLAIHPSNEELIRQLKWWERKMTAIGGETEDAVKVDDHGPDALVAGVALTARKYRAYIEQMLLDAYGDDDDEFEDGEALEYGN